MRQFLLATLFVCASVFGYSQCTPDPQYTEVGFYSSAGKNQLLRAHMGEAYLDIVTIVAPVDSTIPGLGTFKLDSMRLKNISGLPTGMVASTSTPTVLGGQSGCFKLEGTPSGKYGDYNVTVEAYLFVQGFADSLANPVTVPLFLDWALGTEQVEDGQLAVKLAPSPASSMVRVEFFSASQGVSHFELFNALGSSVLTETFEVTESNSSKEFDVSALPSGLYIYKIDNNGEQLTGRLVVSH